VNLAEPDSLEVGAELEVPSGAGGSGRGERIGRTAVTIIESEHQSRRAVPVKLAAVEHGSLEQDEDLQESSASLLAAATDASADEVMREFAQF
jgi:hypothetical protein